MPNITVLNLIRTELAGYIADSEGEIVDMAVNEFMAGKLNPERAYATIGEIVGLRRLALRMDREATAEAARYRKQHEDGAEPNEEQPNG